jgi:carbamate kinase
VKAAADFTEATGRRSVIAGIDAIEAAVAAREGTSLQP